MILGQGSFANGNKTFRAPVKLSISDRNEFPNLEVNTLDLDFGFSHNIQVLSRG